jgi:hypothetical protein
MKRIVSLIAISLTATAAYFYIQGLDVEAVSSSFYASIWESNRICAANRAPVSEKAKFGFVDNRGRFTIAVKLNDCSNFSEGRVAFRAGNLWGYMDINGKEVIPARFTRADDFHHGLAKVRDGIYTGYIDRSGKFIIPARYSWGDDFDESGLAILKIGKDRVFLVNDKGVRLTDGSATFIYPQSEGTFTAKLNEKYGLLDKTGKWLIKPEYDALTDCREGLVAFAKNGKWGFLNKQGKVVLKPVYTQASPFSDGVAPVRLADGRCVLITHQGITTFVFPAKCKAIFNCPRPYNRSAKEEYEDGLVPVYDKKQWGYVSARTGKFVIKPSFAYAEPFQNGRAKVGVLN